MECTKCPLSETRKNIAFPKGSTSPDVIFIGEACGREEDEQGIPFVGRSGKLLDKWIEHLGISNYSVTNIVWCRPPDNRTPTEDEIATCSKNNLLPYLKSVHPKFLIPLGKTATEFILDVKITRMSLWVGMPVSFDNVTIIPMYHPSFILRTHYPTDHLLDQIKRNISPVRSDKRLR